MIILKFAVDCNDPDTFAGPDRCAFTTTDYLVVAGAVVAGFAIESVLAAVAGFAIESVFAVVVVFAVFFLDFFLVLDVDAVLSVAAELDFVASLLAAESDFAVAAGGVVVAAGAGAGVGLAGGVVCAAAVSDTAKALAKSAVKSLLMSWSSVLICGSTHRSPCRRH